MEVGTIIAVCGAALSLIGWVAAIVGTWAVLKYRVGRLEMDLIRQAAETAEKNKRTTELMDKLFDRCEQYEYRNSSDHESMRVTLAKVEATQMTADVVADALLELMKKQDHDTEKYRRRLDETRHREETNP